MLSYIVRSKATMKRFIKFLHSSKFMFYFTFLLNVAFVVTSLIINPKIFAIGQSVGIVLALLVIAFTISGKHYSSAGIIIVFILPLFGLCLYIYLKENKGSSRRRRAWQNIAFKTSSVLLPNQQVIDDLVSENGYQGKISNYVLNTTNMPVYQNTTTKYITEADVYFDNVLEELKKAERYIFIESYIIEQGNLWNNIFNILKIKARQGVEVKVLYDDYGSANRFEDSKIFRKLENYCIEAVPFNKIRLFSSTIVNMRTKRKMFVIDGKTAFISGLNIGDLYVNYKQMYGSWKDTGLMLTGEAVWSMAMLFLTDWQFATKKDVDLSSYRTTIATKRKANEWVQPFGVSPYSLDIHAKNMYASLFSTASKSIYIATPELMLDRDGINELKIAAKSGIDVRIIFPTIPTNKYRHLVSQEHFVELIKAGVKIYEYTPGFMHEKSIIIDGTTAMFGNISLDFRSMHTHFENAVLIYGGNTVQEIKFDYERTLNSCHMLTMKDMRSRKWTIKLWSKFLKLFEHIT